MEIGIERVTKMMIPLLWGDTSMEGWGVESNLFKSYTNHPLYPYILKDQMWRIKYDWAIPSERSLWSYNKLKRKLGMYKMGESVKSSMLTFPIPWIHNLEFKQ